MQSCIRRRSWCAPASRRPASFPPRPRAPSFAVEPMARPPVLCAGCPHTATFLALRSLEARVAGDIGCYTLAAGDPLRSIDTTVCMGASVGNAIGMAAAGETKPIVATIGDSTFLHAGIPPLIDAVYNQANITVVILDNAHHRDDRRPGSSRHRPHACAARRRRKVDYEALCRAVGVDWVRRVDPYQVGRLRQTLREAIAFEGVSVVIAERPCVLDPVKIKGSPMAVALEGCFACQSCMNLGCPAIVWSDDDVRGASQSEDRSRGLHRLHALRAGVSVRLYPTGGVVNKAFVELAAAKDASPRRARKRRNAQRHGRRRRRPGRAPDLEGAGADRPETGLPGQAERSSRHGQTRRRGVQLRALRRRSVVADHRQGRGRRADRAGMGRGPALARLSQAGLRRLHRRHPPHRAALLVPRPPPRRGDPYARETPAEIAGKVAESYALDATTIAAELGEPRAAEHRPARRLSTSMDYPVEDWLATLDVLAPAKTPRDQPQGVRGRPRLGGSGARRSVAALRADVPVACAPPPRRDRRRRLEINEAWCKGCDICVEAVPRALPGADRRADRDGETPGGLHRLPCLRMALPRLRHFRPHRVREPVVA